MNTTKINKLAYQIMLRKSDFLLGDIFLNTKNIGLVEKSFLKRMIELFHMIQEFNDDFPNEMRA